MKVLIKKASTLTKNSVTPIFVAKGKKDSFSCSADIEKKLKNLDISSDFKSAKSILGLEEGAFITIGKGDPSIMNLECFRILGAKFFKSFKTSGFKEICIDENSFDETEQCAKFVEGILLADYSLNDFKGKKEKKTVVTLTVIATTEPKVKALKTAINEAQKVSDAVNFTRRLGDAPGNFMTPTLLAKEAQSIKSPHLKVSVWNKARIKKEKFGGLLSVSLGSSEEPKFIVMEYKNTSKKDKPVCLVGKGLTFDAGGISIKPSARMDEMRYDMCGGGAVIGAMKLIAEMKVKAHVIAFIPSTENLLGASAIKPGDIFTARNGKTVEVLNTDAEGRLILADALSYASEKKPKCILSTATLTGAMVVALGNTHTGYFTKQNELSASVEEASKTSGEKVWRMPVTGDHTSDMKGKYADLSNMSSFRGAGSATAAAFLHEFVDPSIPYAHFDIAGTAWNATNRREYHPNGATGVLVRTFYEFVKGNS